MCDVFRKYYTPGWHRMESSRLYLLFLCLVKSGLRYEMILWCARSFCCDWSAQMAAQRKVACSWRSAAKKVTCPSDRVSRVGMWDLCTSFHHRFILHTLLRLSCWCTEPMSTSYSATLIFYRTTRGGKGSLLHFNQTLLFNFKCN